MTMRVTWYPAAIGSASPLEFDTDSAAALSLKRIDGFGTPPVTPLSSKAPSQEGESALDMIVGGRTVSLQAIYRGGTDAAVWAQRSLIDRAMVNIPVRFGESLDLGRLLVERDGQGDREIMAVPLACDPTWMRAPRLLAIDAEFFCPYPYFQDTTDSELDVPDATAITGTAATDIITASDHDLAIGDQVRFLALTGGTGLTVGAVYYVIAGSFTTGQFKVSTTQGGAAVDFTTNITAGTVAKVSTAVNAGDVDAPIIALIYGPATEVTLTNVTTGEQFTVAVTLVDGTQWLAVNTAPGAKTIRKHTDADSWVNAISGLDLTDARLWLLHPGNNLVRLEVAGGGATTRAELTWRSRYAGL